MTDALSIDELRELSRISPWRSTLTIAKTAALASACIGAALVSRGHAGHALVVVAAIIGIAGAQHGLAVLAHEGAHLRLYQTRWLNELAGSLCAAPLGLSMRTYRIVHGIHHRHLYEANDPDLALMAGYPRGRAYLLRKLAKDLTGITTIKNYT
jgi:fatty acid desaturase